MTNRYFHLCLGCALLAFAGATEAQQSYQQAQPQYQPAPQDTMQQQYQQYQPYPQQEATQQYQQPQYQQPQYQQPQYQQPQYQQPQYQQPQYQQPQYQQPQQYQQQSPSIQSPLQQQPQQYQQQPAYQGQQPGMPQQYQGQPANGAQGGFCTVKLSADRSTIQMIDSNTGTERKHLSLGQDRVQKIFSSPDNAWSVAIYKIRGVQQYGFIALELASCEDHLPVDLSAIPSAAKFDQSEVVLTIEDKEKRFPLKNSRMQ